MKVTVDVALYCANNQSILCLERKHPPFVGSLVLPGGFIEDNETVADAAEREFKEETGIELPLELTYCGLYDEPKRDERSRVISHLFMTKCRFVPEVKIQEEEILGYEWINVYEPDPSYPSKFGFDHWSMIEEVMTRL